VLNKVNKYTFRDYGIQLTESITISGLALKLFISKFYKENLPYINKASVYRDIKKAYYGGITEVYKPFGENLYLYDVNSLYPYVAYNEMPGLYCIKENLLHKEVSVKDYFGFYYCNIEAPLSDYIGLLPVKDTSGMILPVGK